MKTMKGTMKMKTPLEETNDKEWEAFCKRFPKITGQNIISKFLLLFKSQNTQRLIWDNGFWKGAQAKMKN
jgi:hypothetical protein